MGARGPQLFFLLAAIPILAAYGKAILEVAPTIGIIVLQVGKNEFLSNCKLVVEPTIGMVVV